MIPLFEQYPDLQRRLAYVPLGQFPTPVQRLERLEGYAGSGRIYIKRDDISGESYGGAKLRKLEFLLGAALQARAKAVLTFGYAGSNHALATTIYARKLGLQSILELLPQPNAHYVRTNLLAAHLFEAELHYYRNPLLLALGTIRDLLKHKLTDGKFPTLIRPGGSSPVGATGLVNAAFELRNQVERGILPEPDRIYVALGSMGTAVGLTVGLRAAGLKSQVVAVRVAGRAFVNERTMLRQLGELNRFLHARDPSFPMLELTLADVEIRHDFYGRHYALFTDEGMEAVALMKQHEGITLEGTYTGKTLAALLADTEHRERDQSRGSVALFWNTYNSRNLTADVAGLDYHRLPRPLHWYFEHDVQPLDTLDPGSIEGPDGD